MPVFEYTGIVAGDRTTRGHVDAENARAARAKLRADGIFPTSIAEGQSSSPLTDALARLRLPQLRRVPALDLALFSRQLATMLTGGIPLVDSLGALTEQVESTRLKRVVGRVREQVNSGSSLADALAEHPQVFSNIYQSMVRAGETAGALEISLTRLGDYIERQMELRNKVINAMIYPAIMIFVSLAVAGVLLVKVIPTITGLLLDLNQPLPAATVAVIAVSDFLVTWWLVLLIAIAAGALAFNRGVQTQAGRLAWDKFRLRLPVIGRTVRLVAISRFAQTLATLLSGGLDVVTALGIAREVTGNAVLADAIDEAREAITRGASIAVPLRRSGHFPPMVTHMISVGEASGELDPMLTKVAATYDELVENSLNRLTSLMGPVLLIGVAGLVVLIIMSTLLPLLNLTANL